MDLQLTNRRVFITGASAGIGRAAARLFAAEGASLALQGRRENALGAIADEIEAAGGRRPSLVVADFSAAEACADAATKAAQGLGGSIEVLINNAGASAPLDDPWVEEAWERAHRLNFVSSRLVTAQVVGPMKTARWGRIVNLTGAMTAPSPNAAAPAKAALQSWSRSLSIQLAPFGITVNTIAPGRISTDQVNTRLHPTDESRQAFIDRFIPAGRFGEPEELAVLAVFLASPLSRYISGAAIPVDGAMLRIG